MSTHNICFCVEIRKISMLLLIFRLKKVQYDCSAQVSDLFIGIHRAEAFQMLRYNTSELNSTVHVCITSDENTLGGMIALINSIDLNSKHPVKYHLVVDKGSIEHVK